MFISSSEGQGDTGVISSFMVTTQLLQEVLHLRKFPLSLSFETEAFPDWHGIIKLRVQLLSC